MADDRLDQVECESVPAQPLAHDEGPKNLKPGGKPRPYFNLKEFLSSAAGGRAATEYRINDRIFDQGDPASAIFYIVKGKVKLVVLSSQGREAVVAILKEGDFFGEGCLAGQRVRAASAIAMSECSIMSLEKTEVSGFLQEGPPFSDAFIAHLLSRNIKVEEDLVDQLFNSSEKRLARTLLQLANFGKDSDLEAVIPKISQATLAGIVGTTRPRVSFFMNRFRQKGYIEYKGGLKIHRSLVSVVMND